MVFIRFPGHMGSKYLDIQCSCHEWRLLRCLIFQWGLFRQPTAATFL